MLQPKRGRGKVPARNLQARVGMATIRSQTVEPCRGGSDPRRLVQRSAWASSLFRSHPRSKSGMRTQRQGLSGDRRRKHVRDRIRRHLPPVHASNRLVLAWPDDERSSSSQPEGSLATGGSHLARAGYRTRKGRLDRLLWGQRSIYTPTTRRRPIVLPQASACFEVPVRRLGVGALVGSVSQSEGPSQPWRSLLGSRNHPSIWGSLAHRFVRLSRGA